MILNTAIIRHDDDGIERNRVKTFDVVVINKPEPDAFAPKGGEPSTGGQKA